MRKRYAVMLVIMSLSLLPALFMEPGYSFAIGKLTPTPAYQVSDDGELDVDLALERVVEQIEAKEYDSAIELVGKIIQADEGSWEAFYYRAFAYTRQEKWDAAIADYDAVLELRPHDSRIWRLRGDLHVKNSDPRRAKQDYTQSLFFNPRSAQTYASLVRLHERDRDKALRDLYQSIVDASRANGQGNRNRAITILDEAIDSFNRGSLPAELGYAYFSRSNAWTATESWNSALQNINAALVLQPDMQDYYLSRGFIYSKTDALELAGPDFFRRMTLLERESVDENLLFSDSVTVEMDFGLVARIRFAGEAGQVVTISARDILGAGVDPILALLDVNGAPLLGNDDGGGKVDALIANYELPADGVYTVVVSHANGGYEGKIRVTLR